LATAPPTPGGDSGEVGARTGAQQRLFGSARPYRCGADAEQGDRRPHHGAAVERDAAGDTTQGEVAVAPSDLFDGEATGAVPDGEVDRRQHLPVGEGGLPRALEELGGSDRALATATADDQRGVERQRHRRQLGCRICVGDGTSHGAAVADLEMPDVWERGRQQRHVAGDGGIVFGCRLAHQGADAHMSVAAFDRVETGHPVEVDEVLEAGEPQRHHRHEALPPGQQLGLVAVLAEQCHGLVDGRRRVVFESSWLHTTSPVRSRRLTSAS
jgi:hypothetical protein